MVHLRSAGTLPSVCLLTQESGTLTQEVERGRAEGGRVGIGP